MTISLPSPTPNWHAAAIAAASNGINVLPAINKRPTASKGYKHLYQQRITSDGLSKWLSDPLISRPSTGYLVMLGSISGDLCCRDFDEVAGYQNWSKQNPELTKICPTVQTSRGYHVYFRDPAATKTTQLEDGELRAGNALVVGPGSRHESGTIYSYIPGSPEIWRAPTLNQVLFVADDTATTTTIPLGTHQSPQDQSVQENRPTGGFDEILGMLDETEPGEIFIPERLLPIIPGERHKKILKLIRWIKSQHPHISLEDAIHFFDRWWQLAFSIIQTKERWISENEFKEAFCRCTGGRLGRAAAAASVQPTPIEKIESMCRELSNQSPTHDFFLSARSAASVVGCQPMQAHRYLMRLVSQRKMDITKRGTPGVRAGGLANEYRWLDTPPATPLDNAITR